VEKVKGLAYTRPRWLSNSTKSELQQKKVLLERHHHHPS